MDNTQDKAVINKTAVALVASQIYVRRIAGHMVNDQEYDSAGYAGYCITAAERFVKVLSDRGYEPGTLLGGVI